MSERERRIGRNEALFREVNEHVKSINDGFGVPLDDAEFVCECGDESCTERVRISLDDYERLRADPRRFAVVPGHEILDVETVVERGDAYVVVQKHPGEPSEAAASTDPRS